MGKGGGEMRKRAGEMRKGGGEMGEGRRKDGGRDGERGSVRECKREGKEGKR